MCPQIGGIHITWKIGRTIVHPGVLINLTSEIFGTVGALFTDDLCILDIFGILDEERTALSHAYILRLMERVTTKITNCPKSLSFIGSHNALCCILYNHKMMSGCNIHNRVHFTGYTCIMNRYNSFGTFCNRFFNFGLIYIHGIWSDIYEYGLGSTKYESICRRYESKRRHNDFIAFFYICKQCCQLCCLCTGGSQKTFRRSCFFLDPFITLLRKRTVSTDFLILYCLFYIFYFFPCIGRYVKINHNSYHAFP